MLEVDVEDSGVGRRRRRRRGQMFFLRSAIFGEEKDVVDGGDNLFRIDAVIGGVAVVNDKLHVAALKA